jgi:four helix bundle protein
MDNILLENLEIYQLALEVGEIVWKTVESWEWFAKKTIGSQFTRAADSISANIAEGYGRYFYKDRRVFCYYSRGSLLETKNWAIKALSRSLINQKDYDVLLEKMKDLHHKLNIYIKKLNANISQT